MPSAVLERRSRAVLSHVLYCSGIALCFCTSVLPHLKLEHGGGEYSFDIFSDYAGTGNVLLGEAAHQASSKVAYWWYSVSVHVHVCLYAWQFSDFYFREERVAKWHRLLVGVATISVLVWAAVFVVLADEFSTPGVFATKSDERSIASRVSFQSAYRVLGLRGTGAHTITFVPLVCVLLGFSKHE